MLYRNFSDIFAHVRSDLAHNQANVMPPAAEVFVKDRAPIGLTRDGRTVKWMRNVQKAVAYLFAAAGAIIGSFPGIMIGKLARVWNENPIVTAQRSTVSFFAHNIFSDNIRMRDNFVNEFSAPSSREALAAADNAFGIVVRAFASTAGKIGLGVGSIVSSVVVPPISGSVNVIDNILYGSRR